MARAEIRQGYDADGNCTALIMSVECDVLDPADTIDEAVKQAAILWHITQGGEA